MSFWPNIWPKIRFGFVGKQLPNHKISVSAETDCFCRKYSVSAKYSAIFGRNIRFLPNIQPNIRLFSAENFRFLPKLQNILFRPNFGFGSVSVTFLKHCFCFCRNCKISFGRTLVPRYKPGSLTDGFTPILSVEVWETKLGTPCRYYMVIFGIWHQFLGIPCRYHMVILGIWH